VATRKPVDQEVKFSGMTDVLRRLKSLKQIDRNEVSVVTGIAMGAELLKHSVPEAPVVSGALRRSGTVEPDVDSAKAGFGIEYARRIHEGFVGKDKLGRRFNQAANRFMVRGARQAGKDMVAAAKKVITNEVRKRTIPT
jgi:hypothetical protein